MSVRAKASKSRVKCLPSALPRHGHAPDVAASAAAGARRRAEDLGAFAKGIQVTPDPDLGVAVADDLRMGAGGNGALQLRPEPGALVDDREETLQGRGFILGPAHLPALLEVPTDVQRLFLVSSEITMPYLPSATRNSEEPMPQMHQSSRWRFVERPCRGRLRGMQTDRCRGAKQSASVQASGMQRTLAQCPRGAAHRDAFVRILNFGIAHRDSIGTVHAGRERAGLSAMG